jgi:hypothetical protein
MGENETLDDDVIRSIGNGTDERKNDPEHCSEEVSRYFFS